MKNLKKLVLILFSAMFFLFAISVYAYAYTRDSYNMQAQEFTGAGEISLTDSYDSEKSRLNDFFSSKNSPKILRTTYEQLTQNKNIEYYEVLLQSIEYVGRFSYPSTVVAGDSSVIEQDIDGEKITPVKTWMLNQTFYENLGLGDKLQVGKGFRQSDYNQDSRKEIPVILGSDYQNFFSIHDTFEGYYLGYEKICFKVRGFLKRGVTVTLDQSDYRLDGFVLAPVICASPASSEDFAKLLTLVKCEGYLHYKNQEEYETSLKELNKIAKATGFQYSVPNRLLKNENIMGITMTGAMALLPAAVLFFAIGMILTFREMKAFLLKGNISVLRYGQAILLTGLCMTILYYIGSYMNQLFFWEHKEILMLGAERVKLVYGFLSLIFIGLLCKAIWKRSRER